MIKPTTTVTVIFALTLAVFCIQLLHGLETLYLWAGDRFLPHQLLTYAICHGNGLHLFLNCLALVTFGPMLEMTLGWRRFLALYVASVIVSGLAWLAFAAQGSVMLGASGALYALVALTGFLFPKSETYLVPIPVAIQSRYIVWISFALTLALDFGHRIAHSAHAGGILAGLFAFLWIRSRIRRKRD